MASEGSRSFLFLQGPTNYLFADIARHLRSLGHTSHRINICLGDDIFWRGSDAVSFRGRPEQWPGFIADFYREHAVTDLILLGEQRAHHKIAIAQAHAMAIDVSVTDFGYLRPDWVILERNGLNSNSLFTRDPAQILRAAANLPPVGGQVAYPHSGFNQAVWDMAFHLASWLWPWGYPHFKRHTLGHPALNYAATGLRLLLRQLEKPRNTDVVNQLQHAPSYYVFAMQMEDDFSLRAYSHYPELDGAIREVVQSFATHAPSNSQLLFKLHPLDPGLKRWWRRIAAIAETFGVQKRVHFMDGGDLDSLILGSAGFLSVNSTAGLRALELACPTLALGQAIYRIKGLAFDGGLDAFWTRAKPPEPDLLDAFLRLLAASLHVRGGMYSKDAIAAAASGMAYRLHHGLVNQPLAQVLLGESLRIPDAAESTETRLQASPPGTTCQTPVVGES